MVVLPAALSPAMASMMGRPGPSPLPLPLLRHDFWMLTCLSGMSVGLLSSLRGQGLFGQASQGGDGIFEAAFVLVQRAPGHEDPGTRRRRPGDRGRGDASVDVQVDPVAALVD